MRQRRFGEVDLVKIAEELQGRGKKRAILLHLFKGLAETSLSQGCSYTVEYVVDDGFWPEPG